MLKITFYPQVENTSITETKAFMNKNEEIAPNRSFILAQMDIHMHF